MTSIDFIIEITEGPTGTQCEVHYFISVTLTYAERMLIVLDADIPPTICC